MIARTLAFGILLASVALVRADATPPEQLLPATTQVYVRWDGVEAHRDRYRQVTIGRLLESDLAPLVKSLIDLYPRSLQADFIDQKLLDGASPSQLAKQQADVVRASRLPEILTRHGLILAVEVSPMPSIFSMAMGALKMSAGQHDAPNPLMPSVQVTLIVPDAAKELPAIQSVVRLLIISNSAELKEETIADRPVLHAKVGETRWAIWSEAGHVVFTIGTEPVAAVVNRISGAGPKLTTNALFQRLSAFQEFPTDARGFIDLKSLLKTGRQALNLVNLFAKGIREKVDEFGADSFESFIYYSGFDGPTRREAAELDLATERKGIAKLLGGAPLRWEEFPPLPPDVSKWSAHRANLGDVYGYLTKYVDLVVPTEEGEEKEPSAAFFDKAAGIALKEDLFDQLGDLVVTWSSPSEGAIMLGQALAVRVKDGARVEEALDQIAQAFAPAHNAKIRKRPCHDAMIREFQVQNQPGFVILPSYVVYKGWLVIGLYPQPVQAFVQRAAGEGKVWQPDSTTQELFGKLPSKCTTLAFNDLRPAARQALTFAPLIVEASQSFGTGTKFEVGTLPSGSGVLEKLTPAITGVSDDGKKLRWDSRGGLLLPGDSIGIDPMILFFVATFFG
jgi:hypothetical protein